jgi:hypothetical protein
MLRPERESRPMANRAASNVTAGDTQIVAPSVLYHPKAVAPAYAVFVMRKDRRWRRQLYISLTGANKALERARANGVEAQCMLVELVPVPHAPLYVVGGDE